MKNQNYSNHHRFVPLYHFFTLLGIVVLLIGAIVNLINSSQENLYSASLIVLGSLLLLLTAFYTRSFALKAQDRVIRSEENFRHFLLTQKGLPGELTIRQIIGLRFASDDEFLALAERAVKEKMTEKEIKKSIKNWRGDYDRV
jgi:membrane-bound ClpP family serine protease